MAVEKVAEDYFSRMSSTSKRLCQDLKDTRGAYEELWPSLNDQEKADIINETIIKPEARLQYAYIKSPPKEQQVFATKTIVDDYTFRDEHSGPFSFRTPSQMDLRLFATNKSSDLKPQSRLIQPIEVASSTSLEEDSSYSSSIPKTGLDLLDNW